jgi:hypothetical protein
MDNQDEPIIASAVPTSQAWFYCACGSKLPSQFLLEAHCAKHGEGHAPRDIGIAVAESVTAQDKLV